MKNSQQRNNLIIRDARDEDLDRVSLLIRDAYAEYQSFFPAESWQSYLEDIMDVRSRLSDSELMVAELHGQVVGTVTLYLNGSLSREEWPSDWAGIRLLAVHPAFRGRGIGRALMEECVRRCRERKVKTIGLHTVEVMAVALKMYEDMGFLRVPEYDFHPRPSTTVMAYRLRL